MKYSFNKKKLQTSIACGLFRVFFIRSATAVCGMGRHSNSFPFHCPLNLTGVRDEKIPAGKRQLNPSYTPDNIDLSRIIISRGVAYYNIGIVLTECSLHSALCLINRYC